SLNCMIGTPAHPAERRIKSGKEKEETGEESRAQRSAQEREDFGQKGPEEEGRARGVGQESGEEAGTPDGREGGSEEGGQGRSPEGRQSRSPEGRQAPVARSQEARGQG